MVSKAFIYQATVICFIYIFSLTSQTHELHCIRQNMLTILDFVEIHFENMKFHQCIVLSYIICVLYISQNLCQVLCNFGLSAKRVIIITIRYPMHFIVHAVIFNDLIRLIEIVSINQVQVTYSISYLIFCWAVVDVFFHLDFWTDQFA